MPVVEDPKRRFMRLIPKSNDLTLLVLKGHLLIEEQLNYFIERVAIEPRVLDEARLTFFQRLSLVEAFSGCKRTEFPWPFIERLNKLRNHLAHSAEVADIEKRVDQLLGSKSKNHRERVATLRKFLAGTCGFVNAYAEGFAAVVRKQHPSEVKHLAVYSSPARAKSKG